MKCAVGNCESTNNSKACEMSFFSFPSNGIIQKQWVKFCGRADKLNPKTSHICMLHFHPDDIENKLQYEMGFAKIRILKRGTVPSIKQCTISNTKLLEERAARAETRENKKIVASILQEQENKADDLKDYDVTNYQIIDKENSAIGAQHDLNIELENLKTELQSLRSENKELKINLKKQCSRLRSLKKQFLMKNLAQRKVTGEMKKKLLQSNSALKNIEQKLSIIFTPGQILKIKNDMKRRVWTEEDITQSITLYSTSAKLYKLLYRKKFRLLNKEICEFSKQRKRKFNKITK